MRLVTAVPTLFAGVLGLPALVQQGTGGDESLTSALASTVRALEYLSGVQESVEAGEADAIRRVMAATEVADFTVAPTEQEQRLEELRGHVATLQAELDWIEVSHSEGIEWTGLEDPDFQSFTTIQEPIRPAPVTTGIDDSMRQRLAVVDPPPAVKTPNGPMEVSPKARRIFEHDGYVADPLRLGRSQYRVGHYDQAIETLAKVELIEGLYWTARAQEKLGRFDEALAGYERVATAEDAGTLAGQAQTDASFLKWRRGFAPELEGQR